MELDSNSDNSEDKVVRSGWTEVFNTVSRAVDAKILDDTEYIEGDWDQEDWTW